MKNNLLKFLVALLCLMLLSMEVYGAPPIVIVKREEAGGSLIQKLVIKGKLLSHENGEEVSLRVTAEGNNGDDFEKIVLFGQVAPLEEGNYIFEREFGESAGDYILSVASESESEKQSFYFPSVDAIKKLIDCLNNKELTAEQAASAVDTNNRELVFDTTLYAKLPSDVRIKIMSDMIDENTSFNINNIYEAFNRNTLLNALRTPCAREAAEYYNSEYLRLEECCVYPLYKTLGNYAVSAVWSIMQTKSFSSPDEVKNGFFGAVILSAVKNAVSYLNVYDILYNFKTELGCEALLTRLDADSALKNNALKYIINEKNSINSLSNLMSSLNFAINNPDKITPVKAQNASGGGGAVISTDPPKTQSIPEILASSGFSDLKGFEWAKEQINDLYNKNIINGKADGKFAPEDKVTRAEMVKMLVNGLGAYDESVIPQFADIRNHWGCGFIASACAKGYIMGKSAERFAPDDKITRQDAAVILYRIMQTNALALKVDNIETVFIDENEISDYAQRSVKMLNAYGIINGFEDSSFRPKKELSRAESAVLVCKFLKFIEEE